jgi:general secretion pathway protein L
MKTMSEVNTSPNLPLRQQLGDFWSWWGRELAAMLPDGILNLFHGGQRLFLKEDGQEIALSRIGPNGRVELGRQLIAEDAELTGGAGKLLRIAREVIYCLPDDKVLSKQVSLPLAAEENLRQVLAFEMDRQTPFKADQVYFDYLLASRDREKRILTVDLSFSPRHEIDPLLKRLHGIGVKADRLTFHCDDTGGFAPINLLPSEQRPRRVAVFNLLNKFLALVLLLLVMAALALPVWEKHQRLQALEPQLVSAGKAAKEARALRTQIEQAMETASFLVEKKKSSVLVLQLLNEVTQLLPDDTWISQLELQHGEIQIRGQSKAPAALIPILESSPLLKNTRFRSPVTQVRMTDSEWFHLSAEVEQGGGS